MYLPGIACNRLPEAAVARTAAEFEALLNWSDVGLRCERDFMELAHALAFTDDLDPRHPGRIFTHPDRHTYRGVHMLLTYLRRLQSSETPLIRSRLGESWD